MLSIASLSITSANELWKNNKDWGYVDVWLLCHGYIEKEIFLSKENLFSGPELEPGECGAPILCIFYGLLGIIFLFAIYSNIKGMN